MSRPDADKMGESLALAQTIVRREYHRMEEEHIGNIELMFDYLYGNLGEIVETMEDEEDE